MTARKMVMGRRRRLTGTSIGVSVPARRAGPLPLLLLCALANTDPSCLSRGDCGPLDGGRKVPRQYNETQRALLPAGYRHATLSVPARRRRNYSTAQEHGQERIA